MIRMTSNSGYNKHTTAVEVAAGFKERIRGRYFAVTGANSGLGLETARVLVKEGGNVIMLGRDLKRCEAARAEIIKEFPGSNISVMHLDLSSLKSIQDFAAKFVESNMPLHVLINNAGVMAVPKSKTKDGIEMQFGTNHVGHFYLTRLLLPILETTGTVEDPARVVNVSSNFNLLVAPAEGILFDDLDAKKNYNAWSRYGQSKLANILFTVDFQKKYAGKTVAFTCLHPGRIANTGLTRSIGLCTLLSVFSAHRPNPKLSLSRGFSFFGGKSIAAGAATTLVCALDPKIEFGRYYSDCQLGDEVHEFAYDETLASSLTVVTDSLLQARDY
jgi:NAD(P)-dependent dehydrogenase (short-subunit alcohol dehydrogenase family)